MKKFIIAVVTLCLLGSILPAQARTVLRYNSNQKANVQTNSIAYYPQQTPREAYSTYVYKPGYGYVPVRNSSYNNYHSQTQSRRSRIRKAGTQSNFTPFWSIPVPDFGGPTFKKQNSAYGTKTIHSRSSFGSFSSSKPSFSYSY